MAAGRRGTIPILPRESSLRQDRHIRPWQHQDPILSNNLNADTTRPTTKRRIAQLSMVVPAPALPSSCKPPLYMIRSSILMVTTRGALSGWNENWPSTYGGKRNHDIEHGFVLRFPLFSLLF